MQTVAVKSLTQILLSYSVGNKATIKSSWSLKLDASVVYWLSSIIKFKKIMKRPISFLLFNNMVQVRPYMENLVLTIQLDLGLRLWMKEHKSIWIGVLKCFHMTHQSIIADISWLLLWISKLLSPSPFLKSYFTSLVVLWA